MSHPNELVALQPNSLWVALGRIWFRYRSFSPLPLFGLMILLPPEFQPSIWLRIIGVFLILVAESLRIWAVGYAGSATRTRGEHVNAFVHAGPWQHVRNPLYFANVLLYETCCVLFGFKILALISLLFFFVQYSFIVTFEESLMGQKFGDQYRQYKKKVPRWLFSPIALFDKSPHIFDLKKALRSERSTLFAMVGMGVVYAIRYFLYFK